MPIKRSKLGFAAMDPEKARAIQRRGGLAAHAKGTAHEWTREEAKAAGRKGGLASAKAKGWVIDSDPRDVAMLGGDPSL